jgi:hypothetical protein
MSTTDVNQQFHDQRTARINATGAQRRTDGTYAATVGYDRGEVIGRDGLDTSRGTAALYTSTPAWHGLGTVIPGGTTDVDTVLRAGQIDFEVQKRPVYYQVKGKRSRFADHFVTVRMDTAAAIGIVGQRYQVFQQKQMFTFLQELAASLRRVLGVRGRPAGRAPGVRHHAGPGQHRHRPGRHRRRDRPLHRRDQLARRPFDGRGRRHPVARRLRQHRALRPRGRPLPLGYPPHLQRPGAHRGGPPPPRPHRQVRGGLRGRGDRPRADRPRRRRLPQGDRRPLAAGRRRHRPHQGQPRRPRRRPGQRSSAPRPSASAAPPTRPSAPSPTTSTTSPPGAPAKP